MASKLLATASNLEEEKEEEEDFKRPTSDGLQATSDGLQATSDGLQPRRSRRRGPKVGCVHPHRPQLLFDSIRNNLFDSASSL